MVKSMIEFKSVEISDKAWIDELLYLGNNRGCHLNFTNIFAWSPIYYYEVARLNDFLLIKGKNKEGEPYYFYPTGRGDVYKALELLRQDAKNNNHGFVLAAITKAQAEELENLYPGEFEIHFDRDSSDYIYEIDKMVSLAGKKLQAKRNHINRFKELGDWRFEIISQENFDECWQMNKEWCRQNGCKDDQDLANEACAVRRCFKYYYDLKLEGGLLRLNGQVIAFTMGDRLNSDTFDIHIEKAFSDIQGAYQMINREFAAYIHEKYPDIVYLNREEDAGYEGLRKAKLSYRPVFLEEKYWAKKK